MRDALDLVSKTFASDPLAAELSLRPFLQPEHVAQHGYRTLWPIAQQMKPIISASPSFAAEVYSAAYGHRERRQDPTPFGSSQILPMSSNIRQDYEMCWYSLSEAFPDLVASDPEVATQVIVRVVTEHVKSEHDHLRRNAEPEEFTVAGRRARIIADGSSMWLDSSYPSTDRAPEMLASVVSHK
jgi:hypothetical protein